MNRGGQLERRRGQWRGDAWLGRRERRRRDDDVRRRVARGRCQGGWFRRNQGRGGRVWPGARCVGRPGADAGDERRHGEKTEREMELMAGS